MKFLTEEDLKNIYPKNGNDLTKMGETEKKEYIKVYNLYRELYTKYLINKFELKKYDNIIIESGDFSIENEKRVDIYQRFSSDELKYFYIRNNIYVEKLTEEDSLFFLNKANNNDFNLDDESIKMIEKTYSNVIFEDITRKGEKVTILYGPDSRRFLAPNTSIIIGFRYDAFEKEELNNEEFKEKIKRKMELLHPMIKEMDKKFNENSPVPVKIIEYNIISANIQFIMGGNKK